MINKNIEIPYYLQIYTILRERIEGGIYQPNSLLPSENTLVEEFKVTRITIRNAIKKLKDEGRVYTEKGKGSFVNPPKIEQSLFKFYSFGRDYANMEFAVQTDVIRISPSIYEKDIQKKLHLEEDTPLTQILRVRKIEDIPVILETSYIPTALIPDIASFDLKEKSIYDLLEYHYGFKIIRAKEYLDPSITDVYSSNLLEVAEGTPVFITERITYTAGEKPIEFRKSIIRSDKFRFSVELR